MMLIVRSKTALSMSSAPSTSRARAQSIDSAIEGGFFKSRPRLELLVGLVDLVDQEHDRVLRRDRRHEGALHQEGRRKDVFLHVVPRGAGGLGLNAKKLLAVVPFVERLRLVQALVALKAHEASFAVARKRLRELRLADAGGALDQHRLAELVGKEGDER